MKTALELKNHCSVLKELALMMKGKEPIVLVLKMPESASLEVEMGTGKLVLSGYKNFMSI